MICSYTYFLSESVRGEGDASSATKKENVFEQAISPKNATVAD